MREAISGDREANLENEADQATTYIYILRHSNRYAGKNEIMNSVGETVTVVDPETLSPQGARAAQEFGKSLSDFDLVHTISSVEERARQTGDLVKEGSGVVGKKRMHAGLGASPTRKVMGIGYKEVGINPDSMKKAKKIISSHLPKDFSELSPEERAAVRDAKQDKGLPLLLEDEGLVQREAEGVANQLVHLKALAERGVKPGTKVAIPIITHGTFPEAFFMKALVIEDEQTGEIKTGISNPDEIGGFIHQLEGLEIKMTRDSAGREAFDYSFTKPSRQELLAGKKISLDWQIVEKLARDYVKRTDQGAIEA